MSHLKPLTDLQKIDFKYNEKGLIPAVVQDYHTRQVLMMAWMNAESIQKTLDTGLSTFYSRSRQELWTKGETSGNTQQVVTMAYDCDADTILMEVIPAGPACHTGHTSCFFNDMAADDALDTGNSAILRTLSDQIADRREHPVEGSYTNYLFNEGIDKILKKVGEEATETIIAAKNPDDDDLVGEAADLIYHLSVLFNERGISFDDVFAKLTERHSKKRRDEYNANGKIKNK